MADLNADLLAAVADPSVAPLIEDVRPVFLFSRSGRVLRFVNAAGARHLGLNSLDAVAAFALAPGHPTARRIAAIDGQLPPGATRTERLPLSASVVPTTLVARASRFRLAGERSILLVALDRPSPFADAAEARAAFERLIAPALAGEPDTPTAPAAALAVASAPALVVDAAEPVLVEGPLPAAADDLPDDLASADDLPDLGLAYGQEDPTAGAAEPEPAAGTEGETEAEGETDADADREPDADTDGEADSDAEVGADAESDANADGQADDVPSLAAFATDDVSPLEPESALEEDDIPPAAAAEADDALSFDAEGAVETAGGTADDAWGVDLAGVEIEAETGDGAALVIAHEAAALLPGEADEADGALSFDAGTSAETGGDDRAETAGSDEAVEVPGEIEAADISTAAIRDDAAEMPDTADGAAEEVSDAFAAPASVVAADEPPHAAASGFVFPDHGRPVRFVFELDPDLAVRFVSPELEAVVGPASAPALGEAWTALAARLGFDADGRLGAVLTRHDTFTGVEVAWPVTDAALSVPVDLAGMPVFARDRTFRGYRGFGIARTAAAFAAPAGPTEAAEDVPAGEAVEDVLAAEAVENGPAAEAVEDVAAAEAVEDILAVEAVEDAPAFEAVEDAPAAPVVEDAPFAAPVDDAPAVEGAPLAEVPEDALSAVLVENAPYGDAPAAGADGLVADDLAADEATGSDALSADDRPAFDGVPDIEPAGDADAPADTVVAPGPFETTRPDADADAAQPADARPPVETTVADVAPDETDTTAPAGSGPPAEAVPAAMDEREGVAIGIDPDRIYAAESLLYGAMSSDAADGAADVHPDGHPGDHPEGTEAAEPAAADAEASPLPVAAAEDDGPAPDTVETAAEGAAFDGERPEDEDESRQPLVATDDAAEDDEPETVAPPPLVEDPQPEVDDVAWGAPRTGSVIPSPVVARTIPADASQKSAEARNRLSRPEREAFQKIAEALGARLDDTHARRAGPDPVEADLDGPASGRAASEALPASAGLPSAEALETAGPADDAGEAVPAFDGGEAVPAFLEIGVLDRLPVAVAILRHGEAVAVNRAFLDLSGYADLAALEAHGGFAEAFVGSPLVRDHRLPAIRRADGREVPVSVRLHPIALQGSTASMLVVQETAPRTAAEPAAPALAPAAAAAPSAEGEARVAELEAILDTATDGVLVIDDRGTILGANSSAEALFGTGRQAMSGAALIDYLAPESHRAALDYLDGLARNGVASVLNDGREVIGRVARGGLVPLFMTVGRVSPGRFCAVLRDITQWKRAEEELVSAKRSAETASSQKSDFLAKISHEIRTPLNAIIGFSEVMMEERFGPVGSERYKEYLRDIHMSGSLIMSLVNDLLDLSKIEAGKLDLSFEAVPVNEVVRDCVALMQPQANRERIIIRTSLSSSLPNVVADHRSLRQIVLNLLSNAIKFNQPGGQVIVSTLYEDSREVALRVRDTGPGMSKDDVEKALEPFRQLHTTRPGRGTGLGLPLTKALVEANRATFRIESAPGQGTLVQITFPSTRVLAG